jgi:hypothetical protein
MIGQDGVEAIRVRKTHPADSPALQRTDNFRGGSAAGQAAGARPKTAMVQEHENLDWFKAEQRTGVLIIAQIEIKAREGCMWRAVLQGRRDSQCVLLPLCIGRDTKRLLAV